MKKRKILNKTRLQRKNRTRSVIFGTSGKPRFSVFRSRRHTSVQLIDDNARKTLISVSTNKIKDKKNKTAKSEMIGKIIAKLAMEKGIKKAIFDRGSYKYHGRIKAIVEEARKEGLKI